MVLHIVPALFGENDGIAGGAERYAFELAQHMADAVPTSLVTFGDREREDRVGALRVRVIGKPLYVRGQRANPFAFRLLAEIRRASVVHCHQQHVVASSVAAMACQLLRRRVFCTDHGGGGLDLSTFMATDGFFDGHLHISQYSREHAGHGTRKSAHVVSGGVDAAKFSPDGRPRTGGALFVGRILPHKGIDSFVKALSPGVPARIIGPARNQEYLADLHALAAGKPITFEHDCDDATLVEAYRSALCIVLPSVYDDMYGHHTDVPELLGQTLLEGMACGAPALCTAVGSMPEIVEDGVTGFVVPPNDPGSLGNALRCFADNPARTRQMGMAAVRDVTTRFTWSAVVQRCLTIYGLARIMAPSS